MAKVKNAGTALTLEEKLEQALVADWEQPYKVPENWCWTTLKSISNLYNGDRGSNYPSKKDYVSEGIPFINAGAIQNNTLDYTEFNYITQQKYEALRAGKIQKSDILYCLRGSLGKTAIIETDMVGAISSSLCIIRAKRDVLPKYLAYLLRTGLIAQQQDIAENGSAQPNLSAASVMEYKLPISPLNEQQRIVDCIERMFSKLDEVKANVQNVIDGFENRKSAILHKAFNGELTAKWREEVVANSNWETKKLKDVCESIKAGGDKPENFVEFKDEEHQIPVVANGINNDGIIGYTNISTAKSHTVTVSGRGTIGYSIYRSYPFFPVVRLIVISPKEWINAKYIKYVFDAFPEKGTGSSIPQLTVPMIKDKEIPVPLYDEQIEIVRILDTIFAKEQQAKENAEEVLERIELIKKSILDRAFRGELETNNPDEESSAELLKKIFEEDD